MLKGLQSLPAGAAVLATSVAAYPFTLTNRDGQVHNLTVFYDQNGEGEWNVKIEPGETLRNFCPRGCAIALEYDEEEDFEGHGIVTILNGELVAANPGKHQDKLSDSR